MEAKRDLTFVDPLQFTDEQSFLYASKTYFIYKKVVAEVLAYVDNSIKDVEFLKKKEQGKIVDNFRIGTDGIGQDIK